MKVGGIYDPYKLLSCHVTTATVVPIELEDLGETREKCEELERISDKQNSAKFSIQIKFI